jgi:hypothetical protein
MGRRSNSRQKKAAVLLPPNFNQTGNSPKPPFFKNPWVAGFGSLCLLIFAGLYYAPGFLESLQKIPSEIDKTKQQYMRWVKEDEDWSGEWSSFPEGVVDMPSMNLSDTDLILTISADQGEIGGTIATKKICKSIPFFSFIQLEGSVSGNSADVVAYDFVLGRRVNFAQLKLSRAGDVLTVRTLEQIQDWFPREVRLGKSPLASGEEPEPDGSLCADELKELFKQMHMGRGGSVGAPRRVRSG